MDAYRILAINPGSTSTKVAVYRNQKSRYLKTIKHSLNELEKFEKIVDQLELTTIIVSFINILSTKDGSSCRANNSGVEGLLISNAIISEKSPT